MKIKPLFDRVLIDPIPVEEKTSSGLYVPGTLKGNPNKGKVLAVGDGTIDHPMNVKIGETVLYSNNSGTEISIDGKDYLFVKESDIFATI